MSPVTQSLKITDAFFSFISHTHTHTHKHIDAETHTHRHVCLCVYMCVCPRVESVVIEEAHLGSLQKCA